MANELGIYPKTVLICGVSCNMRATSEKCLGPIEVRWPYRHARVPMVDMSTLTRRHEASIGTQPLLDVAGLAARLGVTERFVRRLVDERRIPFLKLGRFVRFDPRQVELWIDLHSVDTANSWLANRR